MGKNVLRNVILSPFKLIAFWKVSENSLGILESIHHNRMHVYIFT